jgi:hypothetical protein
VPARTQDKIWVGLVKAEMTPASQADLHLLSLEPGLRRVFGFQGYRLVGEAHVPTHEKYAQWILPRRDFYLKVEPLPLGPSDNGRTTAQLELYRDERMVTQSVFHTDRKTRVFINGPDCQNGKLIFVLEPVQPTP